MTNREWLRSLTDNELVEIFCDNNVGGVCNICAYDGIECEEIECNDGIAEWLQKEYKNNDKRRMA